MHLCYVGTVLPTGAGTVRLLLRALARARQDDPAALRLRLHFIGTSNLSNSDVHRVLPVAHVPQVLWLNSAAHNWQQELNGAWNIDQLWMEGAR